ncbi:MAG: biotin/lipoyl attachment domain-containing protein, partial [Planctomycetota bacterium]
MVVEGLLYTKDHEWARIEADIATIGITDYAQQMLGELVFAELPAIGKE